MNNSKVIGSIGHGRSTVKRAKKHIFGIGINDYTNSNWSKLRNAVNDLDDFVKLITERYDFDPKNTKILRNEEATCKNIVNTLHHYTDISVLGEDDSLLIYFSGHGFLDKNEDGYWVSVDSKDNDIDSFIPNITILSKTMKMKC